MISTLIHGPVERERRRSSSSGSGERERERERKQQRRRRKLKASRKKQASQPGKKKFCNTPFLSFFTIQLPTPARHPLPSLLHLLPTRARAPRHSRSRIGPRTRTAPAFKRDMQRPMRSAVAGKTSSPAATMALPRRVRRCSRVSWLRFSMRD
jgi:hypothetical protein